MFSLYTLWTEKAERIAAKNEAGFFLRSIDSSLSGSNVLLLSDEAFLVYT